MFKIKTLFFVFQASLSLNLLLGINFAFANSASPNSDQTVRSLSWKTESFNQILLTSRFLGDYENLKQSISSQILEKKYSASQLRELISDATMQWRKEFPIGQVVLTEDDLRKFEETGHLALVVFPGEVGAILVNNQSSVNSDWIESTVRKALCSGGVDCVITKSDFERMTQLLSDVENLQIKSIEFSDQGVGIGQTKLILNVSSKKSSDFGVSVGVDNLGFSSTGNIRTGITVSSANLLPVNGGDSFSLSAYTTNQSAFTGLLSYKLPLDASGIQALGDLSRSQFYTTSVSTAGFANAGSLGILYPFIRGLDANLSSSLKGYIVDTTSTTAGIVGIGKTISLGQMNLDGNSGDRSLLLGEDAWSLHANINIGHVNYGVGQTPPGSNPSYAKFAYQGMARKLLFPEEYVALTLNLKGQTGSTNLDPYEKMLIGGYSGVRAYSLESGSFNAGQITSLEMRKSFYSDLGRLDVLTFIDYGFGSIMKSTNGTNWLINNGYTNPNLSNNLNLAGYGLGVDLFENHGFLISTSWSKKMAFSPQIIPGSSNQNFWFVLQWKY